jgi:hypothetical protein
MAIDDTCLDFYIAAPTVFGFIVGNGRGPDPFANVHQSKIQFVPQFSQNKFTLLWSGTAVAANVPLPSGSSWSWSPVSMYIPPNPWQVEELRIDAPSATRRVVSPKVVNADCGMTTGVLQTQNLPGAPLGGLIAAACPAIDARIVYDLQGANWVPTSYVRDSYPTLDVWRKTAGGYQLLHHSEEQRPGGLLGLSPLKETIQQEQDELLIDPTCQLQ